MNNILDIENLSYTDPVEEFLPLEKYYPGNDTGLPKYRIVNNILYLYISKTLISQFVHLTELIDYCPKKVYYTAMLQKYKSEPTLPMLNGLYFESNTLGSSAGNKVILELPKKKNGDKTVENIRIDDQIEMFKHLYPQRGMLILDDKKNIQIKGKKEYKEVKYLDVIVYLTGEADWITPYSYNGIIEDKIIVDLKLPGNLRSTFGKYSWGSIFSEGKTFIDFTQATMYYFLFNMKFAYWLFDYKSKAPGPENKFFFVNHDINNKDANLAMNAKERIFDFKRSLNTTIYEIINNFRTNWTPKPSVNLCSSCKVLNCSSKISEQII